MNLYQWIIDHHIANLVFMFVALNMIVAMLIVLWRIIFTTGEMIKPKKSPKPSLTLSEKDEEYLNGLIRDRISEHEFDSAMVLMEKGRLKKLEIEELQLKIKLLEGQKERTYEPL
ncbi:MAG: hypothetical protein WCW84_10415 [Sulfurimonas sp.]|jgi:hypothetical protein